MATFARWIKCTSNHLYRLANVKGDIYDDAVNKSKKVYLSKINHIMIDKRPRSIDQLTKEFDKASRAAY